MLPKQTKLWPRTAGRSTVFCWRITRRPIKRLKTWRRRDVEGQFLVLCSGMTDRTAERHQDQTQRPGSPSNDKKEHNEKEITKKQGCICLNPAWNCWSMNEAHKTADERSIMSDWRCSMTVSSTESWDGSDLQTETQQVQCEKRKIRVRCRSYRTYWQYAYILNAWTVSGQWPRYDCSLYVSLGNPEWFRQE